MLKRLVASVGFVLALTAQALAFSPGSPMLNRVPWVLHNALVTANDDHAQYAVGQTQTSESTLFSNSRTGTRWYANASGVLVSAPSGQTLVIPDGTGAPLIQSITNKCTNYNANPPALIAMGTLAAFNAAAINVTATGGDASSLYGIVDDSAAISTAGLGNISNGRVYKIDNSAGATTAAINFSGAVGNTNAHSFSGYARTTSAANVTFQLSAAEGPVSTTSLSYVRLASANVTPGANTRVLQFAVPAGRVGYAILNSLVENSFDIPSPVVVAGASATVGADIRQLIGPAAAAALVAKGAWFTTNAVAGGTSPRLVGASIGGSIFYSASTHVQNGVTPTTNADATFGSGTYASVVKSAFGVGTGNVTAIVNGGSLATGVGANSFTGTAYLGNIADGSRALNGTIQQFGLLSVDATTLSTAP